MACFGSRQYAIFALFVSIAVDSITLSFLLVHLPSYLRLYYCRTTASQNISQNGNSTPPQDSLWNNFTFDGVNYDWNSQVKNCSSENLNESSKILCSNYSLQEEECDNIKISQHAGIIAGLGPIVEIVLIPFAKLSISRLGRKGGYCLGGIVQLIGVFFWYFVNSEWGLFVGRGVQSFGSSISMIAGFANLASLFPEDSERVKACSTAYLGMAMGYLIGYVSGGILQEYFGRYIPFLILIGLTICDIILRSLVTSQEETGFVEIQSRDWSYFDPYILLTIFLTFSAYSVRGLTTATLPKWLGDVTEATQGQIGIVYTSATASEVIAQFLITWIVQNHRQRCSIILSSFVISFIGLITFPFIPEIWLAIIPLSCLRIGEGLFGGMSTSLISYIADIRCAGDYNHLYAVFVLTYSFAFGFVPVISGFILPFIGFKYLYISSSIIFILSALPSLFLYRL